MSRIHGRMPELEEKWLDLLYKHTSKQYSFFRYSPFSDMSLKNIMLMQEIFNGEIELKKQGAVYVGLKRDKGKVDVNGKIKHPFQITKKTAENQITKINDHLLVTGIGIRFFYYSSYHEEVEYKLKNKRFLESLSKHWKKMSKRAIREIRRMQKGAGERIILV